MKLIDVYKLVGCPFYAEFPTYYDSPKAQITSILCLAYLRNTGFDLFAQCIDYENNPRYSNKEFDNWRNDIEVDYYEPLNDEYLHSLKFNEKFKGIKNE